MDVVNTQIHQQGIEVSSPIDELLCGSVTRQMLDDGILDEFPVRIVDLLLGDPAYGLEFLEAFLAHAFIEPESVLSMVGVHERFAYCCVQNIREFAQELEWGYDTVHKYVVLFCALGLLQKKRYQQKVYLQFPLQGYIFPATLDELDKLIMKSRSRVQQLAERVKARCHEYRLVELPQRETKSETLSLEEVKKTVIEKNVLEDPYCSSPLEKEARDNASITNTYVADSWTTQKPQCLRDEEGTKDFEEARVFLEEMHEYTEQCYAEKRQGTLAGSDDLQAAFITKLLLNDPYYYQKYASILRDGDIVQVETLDANGDYQHICDIYPHYFEIGFPINRYAWEYLDYQPGFKFFMFDDNVQNFHLPCYAISGQYSPFDFYTDSSSDNMANVVQEASNAFSTAETQTILTTSIRPEVHLPPIAGQQRPEVPPTAQTKMQINQPSTRTRQDTQTPLVPPAMHLTPETRTALSQLDRYSFLSSPKVPEGKVMVIGNTYDSPYSKRRTPKYVYPHELRPGDITKESTAGSEKVVPAETARQQPGKMFNLSFRQTDEQTGKLETRESSIDSEQAQQAIPQQIKARETREQLLPLPSSSQQNITPLSTVIYQHKHSPLPPTVQPVDSIEKKQPFKAKRGAYRQSLSRQKQPVPQETTSIIPATNKTLPIPQENPRKSHYTTAQPVPQHQTFSSQPVKKPLQPAPKSSVLKSRRMDSQQNFYRETKEEKPQEIAEWSTPLSKIALEEHLIPLEYWEAETLTRLHDKIDYVPDFKLDFTYASLRDLQNVHYNFPSPETFLEVDAYRDWHIADFHADFFQLFETLNVITLIKYIINNNNNILLRNTLITFFVSVFDKKVDDKAEKSRYYLQLFKKGFHPDVISSAFLSTLFTVYGKNRETIEKPGALFIHICQKLQEKVNQLGHLTYFELNLLKKYGKLTCVDLAIALHDNLVEQEATDRLSVYLSVTTTTSSCYRAQLASEAQNVELADTALVEESTPLKNQPHLRDKQHRKYYHDSEQQWKRAQ